MLPTSYILRHNLLTIDEWLIVEQQAYTYMPTDPDKDWLNYFANKMLATGNAINL